MAAQVAKYKNLKLGVVDVTKPKWEAPAIKQFDVEALPYFLLYDTEGNLVAKGQEAFQRVMSWE